jgi:hypothetical protein
MTRQARPCTGSGFELVAAFGVELEPAIRAASEGLVQVITGPVGHGALGLVQQRG